MPEMRPPHLEALNQPAHPLQHMQRSRRPVVFACAAFSGDNALHVAAAEGQQLSWRQAILSSAGGAPTVSETELDGHADAVTALCFARHAGLGIILLVSAR